MNKVHKSHDIASHRQNGGGECRTFAVAKKMQRRVWAAAQQRPSELASAFALHHTCSVIC